MSFKIKTSKELKHNLENIKIKARDKGLTNEERKKYWPLFLNIKEENSNIIWNGDMKNKFNEQIQKDVDRSFYSLESFKKKEDIEIQEVRKSLSDILNLMYTRNPNMEYYQGFHDVATIFLIVLGKDLGYQACEAAGQTFFKDTMVFPFEKSLVPQIQIIKSLILASNAKFEQIFQDFDFGKEEDICRIFDYLLVGKSFSIIYLCAALILKHYEKLTIMNGDIAEIYTFFQNLDKNCCWNVSDIIDCANELEENYEFYSFIIHQNIEFPKQSVIMNKKFNHYGLRWPFARKTTKTIIAASLMVLISATAIYYEKYGLKQ